MTLTVCVILLHPFDAAADAAKGAKRLNAKLNDKR